ncbi:MAG: S26 family signal peptidase [Salinirussus sp.]
MSPRDRLRWFLNEDRFAVVFVRQLVGALLVGALIGLVLFAVSGVWPPMVAVESGSMEPEMFRGDLIFVVEEGRFSPAFAHDRTGVVTYRTGARVDYRTFDGYGDVIVYRPRGDRGTTPVIHRARFWVNESENWYDKADPDHLAGDSCAEVPNCPAPHAGFVTKGDANQGYDQVNGISPPVRPRWITGTAELRIPELGHIRLALS